LLLLPKLKPSIKHHENKHQFQKSFYAKFCVNEISAKSLQQQRKS